MTLVDSDRCRRLLPVVALSSSLLIVVISILAGGCGRSQQASLAPLEVVNQEPTSMPASKEALAPTVVPSTSAARTAGSVSSDTLTPTTDPTVSPSPTPYLAFVPGAFDHLDPNERTEIQRPREFNPLDVSLFSNTLWVGLYGTPAGRGLGILGRYSATDTVTLTVQQALSYQVLMSGTNIAVTPFFHMVTTIADPFPGADGDYVHRVSTETLSLWIDVAHRHGLVSVLDIQPGHSPLTDELSYLEPFLRRRDVHLAVDPEFLMVEETAIPGAKIGSMSGALLNATQLWLNELGERVGSRKALIIHQFDNRMFSDKAVIEDYPLVELVWDADGFGGPGAKIADYEQYATEPGFEYGGFKLFYNYDTPLMTPAQVLSLEPFPVFVVYQ